MPCRHQMIRHLDCVYDNRKSKDVFGIFIVEGAEGVDPRALPIDGDMPQILRRKFPTFLRVYRIALPLNDLTSRLPI